MTFADNIEFGCLIMHDVGVCDEDDDPYESKGEVYQSLYFRKIPELGLPALVKNAITTVDLGYYYGGYLTLNYGANGAVTTSYSETEAARRRRQVLRNLSRIKLRATSPRRGSILHSSLKAAMHSAFSCSSPSILPRVMSMAMT